LIEILKRFSLQRIVILGDAIADQFLYGSISRVSREAPVFILRHEQTETLPGGAANCAMNLVALGAQVALIAVTGPDDAGSELRAKLEAAGVDVSGVIVSKKVQTTIKVRILAGQAHSNKQQVIRIDYDGAPLNDPELRAAILDKLRNALPNASGLVISDYNYGVADPKAIELMQNDARPVLVDSRFHLAEFAGFTAATPNEDEFDNHTGAQFTSPQQLQTAANELRKRLGYGALLVTRGGQGMTLFERDARPLHLAAVGAQQPVDVTGAGDTVIATFGLAVAARASFADAARLANYAGGLVVMKRGTASVSAAELEHSILTAEVNS
jgi:rfaE bifunctional protein kinase chain/domain